MDQPVDMTRYMGLNEWSAVVSIGIPDVEEVGSIRVLSWDKDCKIRMFVMDGRIFEVWSDCAKR